MREITAKTEVSAHGERVFEYNMGMDKLQAPKGFDGTNARTLADTCINRGWCATCNEEGIPLHAEWFPGGYWKDAESMAEYRISALCQGCQDDYFAEGE